MPRRTADPTTTPIVDPEAPFDGPEDGPEDDFPPVPEVFVQAFNPNPSGPSVGVTKRGVSVTVKRLMGSDKNAAQFLNESVELTLSEEGAMDFSVMLKTAQLLSNQAVDMVADAMGIDTVEENGWVRFAKNSGPSPFPQQALAGQMPVSPAYQPQVMPPPQGYAPAPQQGYAPAPQQNGGGQRQANYDQNTKNALLNLSRQAPHLFTVGNPREFNGKMKTPLTPTPAAFAQLGLVVPNPIKSLWV